MKSPWSLPYTPGRGRWLIVGWELGGLAFLLWTTARLFDLNRPGTVLLGLTLVMLWVFGSWRILRMGVYLNERGVHLRRLIGSRTIEWTEIERIIVDDVGPLLGRTVVLELRDGSRVNTALWAKGIDFHDRPGVYRQVYADLRERHRVARFAAVATAEAA
jgi:hypothetical protein